MTNQKVVFSEIEDRVCSLQLDEEEKNHETDVFMEDGDVRPSSTCDQETKDGGWSSVKEPIEDETLAKEEKKEVVHDETIGKGLALDCSMPNEIILWSTFKLPPKEDLGSWLRTRPKHIRKQPPEERKNYDLKRRLSLLAEVIRESQAKRDRPWLSRDPEKYAFRR